MRIEASQVDIFDVQMGRRQFLQRAADAALALVLSGLVSGSVNRKQAPARTTKITALPAIAPYGEVRRDAVLLPPLLYQLLDIPLSFEPIHSLAQRELLDEINTITDALPANSITVCAENGIEYPLLSNLPPKTILFFFPGVGYQNLIHEVGWMQPWFEAFYQAKGYTQQESTALVQRYRKRLQKHQNEPIEIRLQAQWRIMAQDGIFIFPKETISDRIISIVEMATFCAHFLEKMPKDVKVVLLGHSQGAASVRMLLGMYQEGILKKSLEDRRISGSIAIAEAFPGNTMNDWFYQLSQNDQLEWLDHMIKANGAAIKNGAANQLHSSGYTQQLLPILGEYHRHIISGLNTARAVSGIPDVYLNIDAHQLIQQGCTPITVRSANDLTSVFSALPGGYDVTLSDAHKGPYNIYRFKRADIRRNPPTPPVTDTLRRILTSGVTQNIEAHIQSFGYDAARLALG